MHEGIQLGFASKCDCPQSRFVTRIDSCIGGLELGLGPELELSCECVGWGKITISHGEEEGD